MTEERSNSQRAREVFAEKDAREREEREAARSQAAPSAAPQPGGLRVLARVLGVISFVVGALLLFVFSTLVLLGDESVLAQIELGIWSMCFFLAGIYLKLGG